MTTKSIVTGGAGFLGAHLVSALAARGDAVFVVDDMSGGYRRNVPPGIPVFEASVCDAGNMSLVFGEVRPDYVYHLAAYAAEGLSPHIRRFNYENNVVGSMNVVNECVRHKVKRLVFTSSIAVYGHGRERPENAFVETDQPRPIDPYGIAKYAVEMDLAAARHRFGLDYTIFRPHNVYGPLQNVADRYRNVIGIFMNQAMRGEPLTVFGDGLQTRQFSYVSDVVGPIARCTEMPATVGEIYNVGGSSAATVNAVARMVLSASGRDWHERNFRRLPERLEARHAQADHDKLVRTFFGEGRVPATKPLPGGIFEMWDWARRAGPQETKPFPAIELEDGLPEHWRA